MIDQHAPIFVTESEQWKLSFNVQVSRARESTTIFTTRSLWDPKHQLIHQSPLADLLLRQPDLRLASDLMDKERQRETSAPSVPLELGGAAKTIGCSFRVRTDCQRRSPGAAFHDTSDILASKSVRAHFCVVRGTKHITPAHRRAAAPAAGGTSWAAQRAQSPSVTTYRRSEISPTETSRHADPLNRRHYLR